MCVPAADDPIPKLLSFRRTAADKVDGSEASAVPAAAVAAADAAAHTTAPSASAPTAAAATPPSAAVNNIQAAPRLGSTAGAQARLRRIASHVGAAAAADPALAAPAAAPAEQQQARARGMPRSSSAPVLLPSAAVEAVEQHLQAAEAGEAAAADIPTITSGTHSGRPGGPRRWLGRRLAAAAAPVVERAGSAARLVALPLSAAASVPMRAAPQYVPLGRQLFIQPGAVSASKPPPGQPSDWDDASSDATAGRPALPMPGAAATVAAITAAPAPASAVRTWAPPFWPRPPPPGTSSGSQDEDVEDNVDVAAAASMQHAGGTASAGLDAAADEGSSAGSTGAAGGGGGGRRKRRGVFDSHRMATYRNRLLSICQGEAGPGQRMMEGSGAWSQGPACPVTLHSSSPRLPSLSPSNLAPPIPSAPAPAWPPAGSLEGHLMLRALPMLPSLPRPGDIAASELLAPPFFPLRATATVKSLKAAAAVAHGVHLEPVGAAAGGRGGRGAPPAGGVGEGAPPGWRPFAFWRRLLARAAGQQRRADAPIELLIRVEGRGLANVTHAWVEGTHPALPLPPPLAAASKDGSAAPPTPAITPPSQVALVDIVQQPTAALVPPPLQGGRQPLAVVTQLSAFVSW